MNSLRLRNYRCFEDTGDIQLKPITLLVGANSSGKSSFLKFFPLLKQSIGIKKNGVFLWYSNDVDFKDFKNTVQDGKDKIIIDMEVCLEESQWRINHAGHFYKYMKRKKINYKSVPVSLNFIVSEIDNNTDYLENLIISYYDQKIEISFSKNNKSSILINGVDSGIKLISNSQWSGDFIPEIWIESDDGLSYRSQFLRDQDKIQSFLQENGIDKKSLVYDFLLNTSYFIEKSLFTKYIETYLKNEQIDVQTLNNLYVLNGLSDLIEMLNWYIKSVALNVSYVRPLRVMPERYYRYQNYSVNEIASDGKNLAMYFANMTDRELKEFKKWTLDNFGFGLELHKLEGHVEIEIKEKDKEGRNMIDTGFGYNQLLPILAIIWNALHIRQQRYFYPYGMSRIKYIVIEQPELHLHPRILSMFAEMLCKVIANKANDGEMDIRFVIETHSETIINKIGSLIMSEKINKDNVNVVLFNAKNEGLNNYVEQTSFDEKGYLNNWPIGFFL